MIANRGADAGNRISSARLLETLSERQAKISNYIVRGLSNEEIAAELHLSIPTIKAEVSRILRQLEVRKRSEIAVLLTK